MPISRISNLNVQQATPWGMVFSLGYYGSVGHHLLIGTNSNQVVGTSSANQVHPILALSATSPIACEQGDCQLQHCR